MAHNLASDGNKAAMMYVGEVPWHGLGTRFETPPKTADEAMKAAGLDWKVGLKPVYCMGDRFYYEIPDKKAIVRLDKWGEPGLVPFGLVGNDYKVLQNHDAFKFFDPFIQSKKIQYNTAGALGSGERVWVLAKVEGEVRIRNVDAVDRYLLLSTGHDGKTAVQVRFTPVRVVCQNTLTLAHSSGKGFARVYHVPGMRNQLDKIQQLLKDLFKACEDVESNFESMAKVTLTIEKVNTYLARVFPEPKRRKGQKDHSYEEALAKVNQARKDAEWLIENGRGNEQVEIAGTLWAAYNGVIELIDHHQAYSSPWQRLDSLWFGDGASIKDLAYREACAMLAT